MKTTNKILQLLVAILVTINGSYAQEKLFQSTNKAEFLAQKPLVKSDQAKALCTVSVDCSDDDVIKRVVLNTIDNETGCSPNGYGDYRSMTTSVLAGVPTEISVTVGDGWTTERVGIWIDLDNNEQFETSEYIYIGEGPNSTITNTFTLPASLPSGNYPIRVMVYAGAINADMGCYDNATDYGEFEDYTLVVTAAAPCSTVPSSLALITTSATTVCPMTTVNIASDFIQEASGYENQLQSSIDGTTWSNIGSTTIFPNFNKVITDPIQYRLILTCTSNNSSVISNTLAFNLKPINDCYCAPSLDCTDDDLITQFAIPAINFANSSTCGNDGYTYYNTLPTYSLAQGGTYDLYVTVGAGFSNESVSFWIDYNENGSFEESEFTYIGTGSGEVVIGTITVPANAALGQKRMRVRVNAAGPSSTTWDIACNSSQTYGEVEDYNINIVDASSIGISTNNTESIAIYPNPTKNTLSISGVTSNSTIQVIDITGRELINNTMTGNEIHTLSLENFATGSYHLIISSDTGTTVKRIEKN